MYFPGGTDHAKRIVCRQTPGCNGKTEYETGGSGPGAASAGVKLGKSHVSQYVSGKTVPRTDILIFLAQTLHTDSEWLLGHDQDSAFSEFSTAGFQTDARKKSAFSQTAESAVAPPASSAAYSEPSRSESGSAGTNTYSTGGITMREFKKSAKLDNVLYDVRGPVVEEAEEWRRPALTF